MASYEGPDPVPDRGRPRLDGEPLEVAAHVVGEGGDGGVALARFLAERLEGDRVEVAGEGAAPRRRRDGRGGGGITVQDLADDLFLHPSGGVAEGVPVGEKLVEEDAERPDVAGGRDPLAAELLGRRVARRQEPIGGPGRVPVGPLGVEDLRDPEVEELRHAVGGDEDVPRLQVAVHEEPLMGVVHRGADVAEEGEACRDVEDAPAAVLEDVDAVDVLHDEVGEPLRRGADVQEPRDVRVVEGGKDPALGAEAAEDVVGIEPAAHELDRDVSAEVVGLVRREVDAAHPAAPEEPFDAVRPDPFGVVGGDPVVREFSGLIDHTGRATGRGARADPGLRLIEEPNGRRLVRGEEFADLVTHPGVRLDPLEEGGTFGLGELDRGGEELLDPRPALGRRPGRAHGDDALAEARGTPERSGSPSASSRRSQALAASHARRTVIGESSISAAISS